MATTKIEEFYATYYPGTKVELVEADSPQDLFVKLGGVIKQFPIVDVVNSLPRHDTKHYNLRAYDAIETLIIHHTVTPPAFSTEAIAQYHVSEHDWHWLPLRYRC